jgi:beta-glucosidase-like glycosyl hydrolase
MELTKVQNDSGLSLAEVNAALKDGIDIAVGPCSVRVPAQAVADTRAGWSALRAEAGEDAAQRIYEAMAATLPRRLEAAARDFKLDGRPNERTMDSLVNDLVWRHVVGH